MVASITSSHRSKRCDFCFSVRFRCTNTPLSAADPPDYEGGGFERAAVGNTGGVGPFAIPRRDAAQSVVRGLPAAGWSPVRRN